MKNSRPGTKAARFLASLAAFAMKAAVCLLVLVLLGALCYLLFAPVVMKGVVAFRPRLLNLEQAQKYYTLLAAAVTASVGAVGVLLGAFYYFDKLAWERELSARVVGRSRLEDLYTRVDEIDDLVTSLMDATDDAEVRQRTRKVLRELGSFEQLLSSAATSARMTDEQLGDVLRLYSRLDSQCRACLETNRGLRTSDGIICDVVDADEYWDLLYDARRALQRCGEVLDSRSRRGARVRSSRR